MVNLSTPSTSRANETCSDEPKSTEQVKDESNLDVNQTEKSTPIKDELSQEPDCIAEKDSESSCSTVSNCSVMNMNDKLNETIETIPECLNETDSGSKAESPSKKTNQQSSSNQESTFSKVKKSIGSPINIRKTLFKQNSDKRKGSSFKSKELKDAKEQKD